MSLKHAILGVLEARPMSGYELGQFFEASTNWVWSAPRSQIYPLLRQLEQQGLVDSEEGLRGERLRRVTYSITPDGLRDLREWLREDHEQPTLRDAVLLQSVFLDMIDPAEADAVLVHHIERLRVDIERWEAHRSALLAHTAPLLRERLKNRPDADHDRIASMKAHVFDLLIESAQLRVAWAERSRQIVSQAGSLDADPPGVPPSGPTAVTTAHP